MNHTSTEAFEWEPLDVVMIGVMVLILIAAIKFRPGRGVVFRVET